MVLAGLVVLQMTACYVASLPDASLPRWNRPLGQPSPLPIGKQNWLTMILPPGSRVNPAVRVPAGFFQTATATPSSLDTPSPPTNSLSPKEKFKSTQTRTIIGRSLLEVTLVFLNKKKFELTQKPLKPRIELWKRCICPHGCLEPGCFDRPFSWDHTDCGCWSFCADACIPYNQ